MQVNSAQHGTLKLCWLKCIQFNAFGNDSVAILSVTKKSVCSNLSANFELHSVDAVYWCDTVPITPIIRISIQRSWLFNVLTCKTDLNIFKGFDDSWIWMKESQNIFSCMHNMSRIFDYCDKNVYNINITQTANIFLWKTFIIPIHSNDTCFPDVYSLHTMFNNLSLTNLCKSGLTCMSRR